MITAATFKATERVAGWLTGRGYRVYARNLMLGRIKVPLVVKDGPQTVFVEVLVQDGSGEGGSLSRSRAKSLQTAVGRYLALLPKAQSVRIDAVTVVLGEGETWSLEHCINAVP